MSSESNPAFSSAEPRLDGQVVLITGASRGIGRAMAERCARLGGRVALAARNEEELDRAAEAIRRTGGEAATAPCDVTRPHLVDHMLERVREELGPVDLLVNNAGSLSAIGPTWKCEPETWWSDVEVNLRGAFLCAWSVLPNMIRCGRGRIINIVGGGVTGPFPFASAYACSKAALTRLTETLARELDDNCVPVRVFALSPGFVRTPMTRQFIETAPGRAWMTRLAEKLERGGDVSPDMAAEMVVRIGAGELDRFHGRYLHSAEDLEKLDELKDHAAEIAEQDGRVLRLILE
jgi:NAD(P)-dependent dehydrogenase (short-subunit alcohol dehydrogenase family)